VFVGTNGLVIGVGTLLKLLPIPAEVDPGSGTSGGIEMGGEVADHVLESEGEGNILGGFDCDPGSGKGLDSTCNGRTGTGGLIGLTSGLAVLPEADISGGFAWT
jgi:hypothetical protein